MQNEQNHTPSQADQATGVASPTSATPPLPHTPWRPGDIVLGGYRVERELGYGGMGSVHLLVNPLTGARFAVKRALQRDEEHQRRLLHELLTWADLPPHPNLLPFRFFRTDGNEVFLFSDYAEGGSLLDWIRQGRVTNLEQVLDVAIQFAWGLHVGHEHGLVHQDVKPSNALMTVDGRVMVGDFGLARSRAVAEDGDEPPASLCVSHAGMTHAYCSPEQAARQPLTRRTDVWSWGLAVLEMFTGRATWATGGGVIAAEALEDYLARTGKGRAGLIMPEWLVAVLRHCFRLVPGERWQSMKAVIDALWTGWRQTTGSEYWRELVAVPLCPAGAAVHDRRTTRGTTWRDPLIWLHEALKINGRDPTEAEGLMPPRGRWRHTQAMADLVALHQVSHLLERSAAAGNAHARERLALLCGYDRAFVHESLDDRLGASPLYDCAIALLERLVEQEGRTELASSLAGACTNKAVALSSLGESRPALPLYDRAIALLEHLIDQEGRTELASELAGACMNKALALDSLGEGRPALPLYARAIALIEYQIELESRTELVGHLTRTCRGTTVARRKAAALRSVMGRGAAVPLNDRALTLLEQGGRAELANALAHACMNKAVTLHSLGGARAALPLFDRAIALLEWVIARRGEQEGYFELTDDLARVCMNKAVALDSLGDVQAALPLYNRAVALFEHLVEVEDRSELANELARAYMNKAVALASLGQGQAALPLYNQAVAMLQRLVEQEGRSELAGDLARLRLYRAGTLRTLGHSRAALQPIVRDNVAVLRQEKERTGRADLLQVLHWAEDAFNDFL
jgi:tetratricopeptide (TPR) repeat protein